MDDIMIPIETKEGVRLDGLRAPMLHVLNNAMIIWQAAGASSLVVTSTTEGKHQAASLHHDGLAVDLRIWELANPVRTAAALELLLGHDYDVVLEDTHVHVEYDP